MSFTVTPVTTAKNGMLSHAIRISNAAGDTIDLNIASERDTYLLTLHLDHYVENVTIIHHPEDN